MGRTSDYLYAMFRKWIAFSAFTGLLAVALGAMAAHALREKYQLDTDRLQVFETGARYQMYHSFAILATALFAGFSDQKKLLNIAAWLFAAGIVLFSCSLYFLGTRGLFGMEDARWIGAVTPFGGISFMAGWALLGWAALKTKK